MAGRLSFSVAINLVTDEFKKKANGVKDGFLAMKYQILTFAAALGFAGAGLTGFLSRLVSVARETSRVNTALKNVSGSMAMMAENQKFLIDLSKKYGIYINDLTFNYAKFTAAASAANMPVNEQRKIFESLSRACIGFGMTAEDTNSTFLAVTQMMSKGKISAEELRGQLGEKLPVAMQAMAKAAGVSIQQLDAIMKKGKLLSADVLPAFAKALDEMIPNIDTNNIETSLNRLKNAFKKFTAGTGVQGMYKGVIDSGVVAVEALSGKMNSIFIMMMAAIAFVVTNSATKIYKGLDIIRQGAASIAADSIKYAEYTATKVLDAEKNTAKARLNLTRATEARIRAEKAFTTAAGQENYNTLADAADKAARNEEEAISAVTRAQKKELTLRTAAQKAEIKAQQAASAGAQANATGRFTRLSKNLMIGVAKLKIAIVGLWNAFAPAIIISAIVAIIGHFKSLYDEAKKIKNIFSEYKKETISIGRPEDTDKLQRLHKIVSDTTLEYGLRKKALSKINEMLGTAYSIDKNSLIINGDINSKIAERIKLLKDAASIDFYQRKKIQAESDGNEILSKYGGTAGGLKKARNAARNKITLKGGGYNYESYKNVEKDIEIYNQHKKIWDDASQQLNFYEKSMLSGSVHPVDPKDLKDPVDTEDHYIKAVKNYTEESIKLENKIKAGVITQKDYNLAFDKLNKEAYELLGGLLGAKSTTDTLFLSVKENIENPKDKNNKKDEAEVEYKKIQKEYNENLKQITNKHKAGLTSEKEYQEAVNNLTDSTLDLSGSLLGAEAFTSKFYNDLFAKRKEPKIPEFEERDATFDYKKSKKEITEEKLEKAQEYYDILKKANDESMGAFTSELNNMMLNVKTLGEALKIAEVQDDVKELKKNLNEGLYSGIKDIANSADRMVSSFGNLNEVFSNTDASGWEKIIALFNTMIQTVDGIMSVIQTITALKEIFTALTVAKKIETQTAVANATTTIAADTSITTAKIANNAAILASSSATILPIIGFNNMSAKTGAVAAAAAIPFPGNIAAMGASLAATMAMLATANIPMFANGGIVKGNSISGDNVLARVNSREMILNQGQQSTLFGLLNNNISSPAGFGIAGGKIELRAEGSALVGVINNYNRRLNRIK